LPLTGAESRIGGFFKEGYELAFEQATQNGGISVGGQKMPVRLTAARRHQHAGHGASSRIG